MASIPERNLAALAEVVRDGKERGQPCSILIGAGCSVTANIPLAAGFVEKVEKRYPQAYERAAEKTYPLVMREVDSGLRYNLIAEYVDEASLNWSHLLLGWLVRNGYVGRVLTTNFDNLTLRACSQFDVFPSIYDLAASSAFRAGLVRDPSVFFLHGQHGGFVQLHTPLEVEEHAKELKPVFDDASIRRTWIVVGYSGDNDPVFENLAAIEEFTCGLYWVGYKDRDPSPNVCEHLLSAERQAYLVRGHDSDQFFIKLMRELGLPAPPFVSDPFSHMIGVMERFAPFPAADSEEGADITASARRKLEQARDRFADPGGSAPDPQRNAERLEAEVSKLIVEGKYAEAVERLPPDGREMTPELRAAAISTFFRWGNALEDQAETKADTRAGDEADELFKQAIEKYSAALEIDPGFHSGLISWGDALRARAATKSVDEADELFKQAVEKYSAAFEIEPRSHWGLNGWGNALTEMANATSGDEVDELARQAIEKYSTALKIKPGSHVVISNWGNALTAMAKARSGDDADELFRQAIEKYSTALEIEPTYHLGFYNMACLSAVRGDLDECLTWLEKRRQTMPPLTQWLLEKDSDFDGIRNEPAFTAFAASLDS